MPLPAAAVESPVPAGADAAPGPAPAADGHRGHVLQIGLFFDGTRNNALNLVRGRRQPHALPEAREPDAVADDASTYQSRITSSSDNGPTNIARLHRLYPDSRSGTPPQPSLAIYIEGTGTRDGERDDLVGLAFGTGPTGVRAKVRQALEERLPQALAALAARGAPAISGIAIDLFGYSRGAASARDATNTLASWHPAHWQGLLREAGLRVADGFALPTPRVRFVGLFDTVLAVRTAQADQRPQVGLSAGIAAHVLHLVARDEHRHHFALTTVAPEHIEIALPGVHANVGGGYDQTEEGPKLLTRPRSERARDSPVEDFGTPTREWLQGTHSHRSAEAVAVKWRERLGADATTIWVDTWHQWLRQRRPGSGSVQPTPTLYVYSAVVLKRPILWHYQLIPLRVMHRHAEKAGVAWTAAPDDVADWALPDELQEICARLLDGAPLDDGQEALLRRRYLMQSAHWNFDVLGDTALVFATDADVSELPYRPGPRMLYVNRPSEDGRRLILPNV